MMHSVDQVADQLGLHARTVRGYIRDGRLKATRIGKQYRIASAHLEAFTGASAPVNARRVEVSAIVEIEAISPADASRLSTLITASLAHHRDGDLPARVETAYDKERQRMKIIGLGSLATGSTLLGLVGMFLEAQR